MQSKIYNFPVNRGGKLEHFEIIVL